MYQEFFSLKEQPFSISPDPDFLFLSDRHKEAFAHLRYGLEGSGGFVLLTGEVGTGKTTVCRALMTEIPSVTDVAFVLNPAQTEVELLATICKELKIDYDIDRASLRTLFDAISEWMLCNIEKGRHAIVLIDEAQHLSFSVLELLRLLTNIESNNKKPLQVILIGQTELQQKLKQNELRQLAQRITARYHLLPLNLKESRYYIQHRLSVGGASYPIFDAAALNSIFKYSGGIPRLINLICDRSMLCAYSQDSIKVNTSMVELAVKEIDLSLNKKKPSQALKYIWRATLLVALSIVTVMQAPQIYHHFIQPSQAIETVGGLMSPVKSNESNNSLPNKGEQLADDIIASIPVDDELTWFDNYPELDLSNRNFSHALQALYAVWGYSVDLEAVDCAQGASVSLYCFSDSTTLTKLKELNYPGVIKLLNDEDEFYAVIYKVGDLYELLIGTQKIQVTGNWLDEYWNGGLTLLWRAPFEMGKSLGINQSGEKITWLSENLNLLYGRADAPKHKFDWQLKKQVMKFQEENNLIADGYVGKRTLLPLMQQLDPTIPSLL